MTEHVMRRQPRQARGQERIDAILDAALQLFAEDGYDATTTNAIAERAGAKIGSLYHYFPNKEAILEALKERMMDALRDAYFEAFTPDELRTLPASVVVDRVIDRMVQFDQTHEGFMQLFYGSSAPTPMQFSSAEIYNTIVGYLQALLQQRLPEASADTLAVSAGLMINTTKAAMIQMRLDPPAAARILAELKRMLSLYTQSLDGLARPPDHRG